MYTVRFISPNYDAKLAALLLFAPRNFATIFPRETGGIANQLQPSWRTTISNFIRRTLLQMAIFDGAH